MTSHEQTWNLDLFSYCQLIFSNNEDTTYWNNRKNASTVIRKKIHSHYVAIYCKSFFI